MPTNITGTSRKVNYFETDVILTNHRMFAARSTTNFKLGNSFYERKDYLYA